ncbi:serine hydrolase [Pseudomonas sp. 21TX0197]|uniref:serine hydrolase domain-containing protein n=1 Tax=Pseudomonas TaxID=286 RepID=UPI000908A45A|nr:MULTISPECIES: serine hydrolase domain-containing protein [Pseudomonas]MDB6444388.1 serine hydrolase [Pseudomonas sp. 21TX0197]MDT8905182.1 serine hydrolase domain-containing protein [Pseudomonas prosekii]NHN67916.1 beta-lactamase family protein [Pseudomonas fluorescens]ROO36164.1 hydrolase [Pseudomonas sp. AF76]ROO36817.1 hydrolase [Pseudomonas sp. 7SR1]
MSQNAVPSLASLYVEAIESSDPRSTSSFMQGFPPEPQRRVSWHNWMRAPFNQWGFRNLARLRPSIDVQAGAAPVSPLQQAPQPLDQLHFNSECGLSISVIEHLLASQTDAFLVMQGDTVLYERYFNGQRPQDRHIMFSVTKSLIGTLGEQLVCEGLLDTALPAAHYVPELAGSAFADATVRQLFDMAVGIDYSEVYEDPDSESSQYGYACGFQPAPVQYGQFESLYEYLPSLRKRGSHGGFFHYVTATTEALAWVMERACGRACHELLQDIWSQLGCERDGYFMADPWGRNVAGAGFSATLRDMARFGRLLANEGRHAGRQLLSSEAIAGILAGADPAVYATSPDFSAWTPGASYRSQWYVFNDHSQALMAGGIHGQYLFVDKPSGVVIVKQSSLSEAVSPFDGDSVRMLRAIAAHLTR